MWWCCEVLYVAASSPNRIRNEDKAMSATVIVGMYFYSSQP